MEATLGRKSGTRGAAVTLRVAQRGATVRVRVRAWTFRVGTWRYRAGGFGASDNAYVRRFAAEAWKSGAREGERGYRAIGRTVEVWNRAARADAVRLHSYATCAACGRDRWTWRGAVRIANRIGYPRLVHAAEDCEGMRGTS